MIEEFKVKPALLGFNTTGLAYEIELMETSKITVIECEDSQFPVSDLIYENLTAIRELQIGTTISMYIKLQMLIFLR